MQTVKVLVVDDSVVIQQMIAKMLGKDPHLEVVGFAKDPYDAREKIKSLSPDVLTLDIEMPRMDGLTFISKLMDLHPMPVIVISSLTEANSAETLKALELGAIDVMCKPTSSHGLDDYADELRLKVHSAAKYATQLIRRLDKPQPRAFEQVFRPIDVDIIAIGGSTGATEAIRAIFQALPANLSPIVITQHLLKGFLDSFVESLNHTTAFPIQVATEGQRLEKGQAYLAPADTHMQIVPFHQGGFKIKLLKTEPVVGHRPSVDVMFESLASCNASKTLALLLTGMGCDGADGLAKIKDGGGVTIAQDEQSSVVWGMPRVAIERDAVHHVLHLDQMAAAIKGYDAVKTRRHR